jgi:uncharacterized protein YndB with AHSA1/START domain
MNESSYTTTVRIDRPPLEVFSAINDVRGWWSEEVVGDTDRVGAEYAYRGHDDADTVEHRAHIRVEELVPGERVVWRVLDNYMSFIDDQTEWAGTEIRFELSAVPEADGRATELRFTHVGLVPSYECFDVCKDAWGMYIRESLPAFVTTGRGNPIRPSQPAQPAAPVGS